jgi:putative ABC transport system permease protein
MSQAQALLLNMFEQGFLFAFLGLGVLITFRFFRFPDLTAEGSYPLGGAVAAALLVAGANPFVATLTAILAGAAAGLATALVHTKLRINNIIAGIIVMTALYTVNLRVMGKANTPLLNTRTVFGDVAGWLGVTENVASTIPIAAVMLAAAAAALVWFFHTDLGVAVRATGHNETMALSLGVNVDRTKMIGLALSNGFIALSGALVAQNHGFADIGMGIGILVTGAAAVLIGEAIFGDRSVAVWVVAAIVGVVLYRLPTRIACVPRRLAEKLLHLAPHLHGGRVRVHGDVAPPDRLPGGDRPQHLPAVREAERQAALRERSSRGISRPTTV